MQSRSTITRPGFDFHRAGGMEAAIRVDRQANAGVVQVERDCIRDRFALAHDAFAFLPKRVGFSLFVHDEPGLLFTTEMKGRKVGPCRMSPPGFAKKTTDSFGAPSPNIRTCGFGT